MTQVVHVTIVLGVPAFGYLAVALSGISRAGMDRPVSSILPSDKALLHPYPLAKYRGSTALLLSKSNLCVYYQYRFSRLALTKNVNESYFLQGCCTASMRCMSPPETKMQLWFPEQPALDKYTRLVHDVRQLQKVKLPVHVSVTIESTRPEKEDRVPTQRFWVSPFRSRLGSRGSESHFATVVFKPWELHYIACRAFCITCKLYTPICD